MGHYFLPIFATELGVVYFESKPSGFVGTAGEKEKADEIARKVKGVAGVKNNIIVK